MKRIVSVLLVIVLLIGCLAFSANAQSAKITGRMQNAIDNSSPDDVITAAVWLVGFTETVMDMPGSPDYTQSKAELEAVRLEQQERLYPEVFGGLDAEPLYRGAGSLVVVRLKAADIPTVADNSSVKLVDLWTYAPTDEKESSQEDIDKKIGYGSSDILLNMINESDPETYFDEIVISFKGFPETADDMPDADFYQRRRELTFLDAAKMSFLRPIVFSGIDADLSDTSMNYLFGSFKAKDIRTIASYKAVNYIEYWGNAVLEPEVGTGFYKDRFDEFYPRSGIEKYEELYYHKDKNGEVDWALIKVKSGRIVQVQDWEIEEIVGNRIVIKGDREYPFANGYGVYDVKEDKFVSVITDHIGVVADYEGLGRAYDEFGEGRLIGDLDMDDELTVIDATIIQRCDVRMRDWGDDDLIEWNMIVCNDDELAETGYAERPDQVYYSDFNRDGERDVVDATMLQRYVTRIG